MSATDALTGWFRRLLAVNPKLRLCVDDTAQYSIPIPWAMRSDPTLYPSRRFRWLTHNHGGGPVPILSMEGMSRIATRTPMRSPLEWRIFPIHSKNWQCDTLCNLSTTPRRSYSICPKCLDSGALVTVCATSLPMSSIAIYLNFLRS